MKKLSVLSILLAIVIPCSASTITVNWDGTGDHTTIQAGINAAVSGADTIIVAEGTYIFLVRPSLSKVKAGRKIASLTVMEQNQNPIGAFIFTAAKVQLQSYQVSQLQMDMMILGMEVRSNYKIAAR